jgi:hypothetical protein
LPATRDFLLVTARGCTRHALPSPENGQYHHQPHQLLRSGRILAKHAKAIDRQAVDWNLVVGGPKKRTLAIAVHTFKTLLLSAALRPIQQLISDLPVSAMRGILF